ncbi:MAG TPA: hypothetical protein PLY32_03325 [Salinivirgaceae bacterium]|nr:hypothetical protein [Salinivirgaceae bacterium]HQA76130.1 hypothetical protein [Salinivirgaceae bacterium]
MKKLFTLALIALFTTASFSQTDVSEFLSLGIDAIEDIETLSGAYLNPIGKGLATTLSSGWNNTAATHRVLGFDFSVGFTLTTIPSVDKKFNLNDYNWKRVIFNRNEYPNPLSPTVAGKQDILIPIGVKLSETMKLENIINMPDGVNLPAVGLPIVHFGIGVFKGTDLQLRALPPLTISDYGKINMFGAGIKHDFKQWIPVVNKLPFDASFAVNYSVVNSVFDKIKYFPTEMITIDRANIDNNLLPLVNSISRIEAEYYNKQELLFRMNSFSANLLLSKSLLFLTVYGSVGYSASASNIQLAGPYLLPSIESDGSNVYMALREKDQIEDPIDITMKHSSLRAGFGLRFKFAVITLHGEVTYQDYTMYNFGLGIAVR